MITFPLWDTTEILIGFAVLLYTALSNIRNISRNMHTLYILLWIGIMQFVHTLQDYFPGIWTIVQCPSGIDTALKNMNK